MIGEEFSQGKLKIKMSLIKLAYAGGTFIFNILFYHIIYNVSITS